MRKAIGQGMLMVLYSFSLALAPGQISLLRVTLAEPTPKIQQVDEMIVFRLPSAVTLPLRFHVRIFRGSINEVRAKKADKDDCITYDTGLLDGVYDSAIHFDALSRYGNGWLRTGADGRFAAEDLVLVFEAGGQPEDTRIRLHQGSQLNAYFRYAIPMKLQPSSSAKAASAQVVVATKNALEVHRAQLAQLPLGPCSEVKEAANDRGDREQVIAEVAAIRSVSCGGAGPMARVSARLQHLFSSSSRWLSSSMHFRVPVAVTQPLEHLRDGYLT
jgi:hypothetical protein